MRKSSPQPASASRAASEPQRLWKRYLVTNSVYVWLAARQLLTRRAASR